MFCVCEWNVCMCVCVCLCVLTGVPSCRMGLYKAGKPWGRGGDSELWGQATWRAPLPATGLGQGPGHLHFACEGPAPGSWDNVLGARGCPSPARPVSAQCPWAPPSEGHPLRPWKGLITPNCTEKTVITREHSTMDRGTWNKKNATGRPQTQKQ